jgi:hypothetical protein
MVHVIDRVDELGNNSKVEVLDEISLDNWYDEQKSWWHDLTNALTSARESSLQIYILEHHPELADFHL